MFKLSRDGGSYSVLYHFGSRPSDGVLPNAGLVGGDPGVFWGTTMQGGSNGFGTIYRLAFPPALSIVCSGGDARITLIGFTNQPCSVQASSNLAAWSSVADLTLTNGRAQFLDTAATNASRRFYRALVR